MKAARARQTELAESLREMWPGIENLRGYQHVLTDGCEASKTRGRSFGAHIDAILDRLRAALVSLEADPQPTCRKALPPPIEHVQHRLSA